MDFKINALSHFLRSIRVATKEAIQKKRGEKAVAEKERKEGRKERRKEGRKERRNKEGGRKKENQNCQHFLKLRAVQGASS